MRIEINRPKTILYLEDPFEVQAYAAALFECCTEYAGSYYLGEQEYSAPPSENTLYKKFSDATLELEERIREEYLRLPITVQVDPSSLNISYKALRSFAGSTEAGVRRLKRLNTPGSTQDATTAERSSLGRAAASMVYIMKTAVESASPKRY